MNDTTTRTVTDAKELAQAISDEVATIVVEGEISGSAGITLPAGTALRGGTLRFGAAGVRLTRDNTLEGIRIVTGETEAAILNDTSVENLGTLTLRDVTTVGQIVILAEDSVRAGHVHAERVHVESADVRGRLHRPHGFGVDALQGAFTIWNRRRDTSVRLTAELLDISVGTEETPVRCSGIFVGGHGDREGQRDGGTIAVSTLRTGEVCSDGGITPGTADLISGGVFVITGADVETVENTGPVTTLGANDMVLDNWGAVKTWRATAPVTSHGPSGIGFVNVGDIGLLDVQAPIVTTGTGARGFTLYDGSLVDARFESIATTGGGSIGIEAAGTESDAARIGEDATVDLDGIALRSAHGKNLVRG
ncbi:hypothetical protein [Brachybacterium huguangmaarense]